MQDVCATIEGLLFLQRPVFPSELRGPLFQRPVLGSEFPVVIHTRRTPIGSRAWTVPWRVIAARTCFSGKKKHCDDSQMFTLFSFAQHVGCAGQDARHTTLWLLAEAPRPF